MSISALVKDQMKFLAAFSAAVALVATPASALPSRGATTYAVVSGDETALAFVPNASEKTGNRATVWTGIFMHDRITAGNEGYDVVWMLNEYDCSTNTVRVLTSAVEDFAGEGGFKIVENTPGPSQQVVAGSPNHAVLDLACLRTTAKFLTTEELATGFITYRSMSKSQLAR